MIEGINCFCKKLILNDTKDCLLVCSFCKESMESGDLEVPSQMFAFARSCSEENPCNEERYFYVFSWDNDKRISFRDLYKRYNCIFCMPRTEYVYKEIIGVNIAKDSLLDESILVKLPKPLRVVEVENEE